MRFCDVCESLLSNIITTTELYYQCTRCQKKFKASPEDTLCLQQSFDTKTLTSNTFMKNAAYDKTCPKIYKECPKCKASIVNYIVVGDSLTYVYVCECGYSFKS